MAQKRKPVAEQWSGNRSKQFRKKKKKVANKKAAAQLLIIGGVLTAIMFLPTTLLLIIGMAPTPAAALIDRSNRKIKILTVGAMNMAGCAPFIIDLWLSGNAFDKSFSIITDPVAIIIMYAAAGVGYMLDWSVTGIVSSMMYERGKKRIVDIEKRQADLVKRWGPEVTGELNLDEDGFPIEGQVLKTNKQLDQETKKATEEKSKKVAQGALQDLGDLESAKD